MVVFWKPEMGANRKGQCIYCGACCSIDCPAIYLEPKTDMTLSQGDSIKIQDNFLVKCSVFEQDVVVNGCDLKTRKEFPSIFASRKCPGYYFVTMMANRLNGNNSMDHGI